MQREPPLDPVDPNAGAQLVAIIAVSGPFNNFTCTANAFEIPPAR